MTIKRVLQYVVIVTAFVACAVGLTQVMNMTIKAHDDLVIAHEILSGRCVCERVIE